jgi:hypothetical protein
MSLCSVDTYLSLPFCLRIKIVSFSQQSCVFSKGNLFFFLEKRWALNPQTELDVEWVGKSPPTFKGNGFSTWLPFNGIHQTLISSHVLAKICKKKNACWCELISVVGSRIVVATHQPISSFGILWKSEELFHTFRAKSFFFIENGNRQQPLYSTHGTSPALDASLWLPV